jgi:hypothetical protein
VAAIKAQYAAFAGQETERGPDELEYIQLPNNRLRISGVFGIRPAGSDGVTRNERRNLVELAYSHQGTDPAYTVTLGNVESLYPNCASAAAPPAEASGSSASDTSSDTQMTSEATE